jgi:hypothetical protein
MEESPKKARKCVSLSAKEFEQERKRSGGGRRDIIQRYNQSVLRGKMQECDRRGGN